MIGKWVKHIERVLIAKIESGVAMIINAHGPDLCRYWRDY
jgi:hypothetical protein